MIDAHQHFWRVGRNDCTWPTPDLAAIHRDFVLDDLAAVAGAAGVTGTVLVQSQPSDRDTDWMLAHAGASDLVKAVVGWVDLSSPTAPARIADLAARPKLRGLRPMLQGLPQDDWILRPELAPALEAMVAHALSFDALVFTRHLPHVRALAERYPTLPIVIDHAAKPPIASGDLSAWRAQIAPFADLPQVCCKISGLLTEAAPNHGARELSPVVDYVLDVLGPARVMWGSDWPVLNLAGDYVGWRDMSRSLTERAGADGQAQIFSETARRFYRL